MFLFVFRYVFVKDGFAKELWCSLSGRLSVLISCITVRVDMVDIISICFDYIWIVFDWLHGLVGLVST